MTIEIKPKVILMTFLVFIIFLMGGISGYFYGTSTTKSEYEAKIKAMENPKGDGYHFYLENSPEKMNDASTMLIYHSTLKCKDIKYGTLMDSYGYTYKNDKNKRYPYYSCAKCMDTYLINKLNEKQNDIYAQMGI